MSLFNHTLNGIMVTYQAIFYMFVEAYKKYYE